MVNASDSGSRGRGSSPTRVKRCCVLEQGTLTPPKVLVIPRKRWLRPNMTEKLFTGTLRINQSTNQQHMDQVFFRHNNIQSAQSVWSIDRLLKTQPHTKCSECLEHRSLIEAETNLEERIKLMETKNIHFMQQQLYSSSCYVINLTML